MSLLSKYLARQRTDDQSADQTIYCDYAAATPLLPEVLATLSDVHARVYANPSAIHQAGQESRAIIEAARVSIARLLLVRSEEIYFTGSGTEANNIAILGYIESLRRSGQAYTDMHIVTTRLEHPSVLRVCEYLAEQGVAISYLPVSEEGFIFLSEVANHVTVKTVLVTFSYAQSEVGVVQPVRRLVRTIKKINPQIRIHLDAAQAPLWLPLAVPKLGVDMISLDASKCNGPKGVGVLLCRHTVSLAPVLFGGGQEQGIRPGTENPAAIAAAAVAIEEAIAGQTERNLKAKQLQETLLAELATAVPNFIVNGPHQTYTEETLQRLPNNVHISLPGFDTEYAVVYLDTHGIAASTKSACSGVGGGKSEAVYAMTDDMARATATIRFSIDPTLQPAAMKKVAYTLKKWIDLQNRVDAIPV